MEKLFVKKLIVAVLACTSSIAFSGSMGPICTPGNTTVACDHNGWGFGAQALYLHPAYSGNLSYLGSATPDFLSNEVRNDPNWSWGFKL
ncbi:MAG: Lpg1974 family pore-forming outer membrane protein, partial [bacterium]|nr:Lpg1974 family pore-forming outer membrane protein [bacterium]